jgi:hypothetical protein
MAAKNPTDALPFSSSSTVHLVTPTLRRRDYGILPIPARLQHDSAHPPAFGWVLNITFALASTFCTSFSLNHENVWLRLRTVIANLYYCQPLLSEW